MTEAIRRWRASLRTRPVLLAVVCGAVVAGVALSSLVWLRAGPVAAPHTLPAPLVAAALVALQLVPVRFHAKRQTYSLDLFSVPLMVGAALTPVRSLMVGLVAANFVGQLLRRSPLIRLVFNLGNQAAAAAVALMVWKAALGGSSPVHARGWLAMAAAAVTYELFSDAGVMAAMGASGASLGWARFRGLFAQLRVLLPLCWALSLIAVTAFWVEPLSVLVLASSCLVVALLYRSVNRLRDRFGDVQSLYRFNMRLSELSVLSEILTASMTEAREVLRCERIQLWLPGFRQAVRYSLDDDGTLRRETTETTDLERRVMEKRQAVLVRADAAGTQASELGFKDLMAVPVAVDGGDTAALIVANRNGDTTVTFDADDLELLHALAAHLATAMTSAGRLDRLENEVAARKHEAYHDSLTGLANRSMFSQVLTGALKSNKADRIVAVLLMDLDGFKEINDTLGHHTGDGVLKEVARRLNMVLGDRCIAARLGGDEFAVVITHAPRIDEIRLIADEALQSVGAPMSVAGMTLTVRASIGVSIAPLHGDDAASLLRRADVAMYAAKKSGQDLVVYDPKIDHHSTRRLMVAAELQRAVEEGALELWYQPVAEVATAKIVGLEGLLRWNSHELGPVTPGEFIPVAEQSGLIEALTWWVVRTALMELKTWRQAGYDLSMAVNISARTLFDSAIVERLNRMTAEIGVHPSSVTLEVTESSMMLELNRSERILRQLSQAGFRIAIDDFGTGYSSLARLKVLPVDIVKIDRTFIQHMGEDMGDQAVVRSTLELARVMGHVVVAEGVEDAETWRQLQSLGCAHAQGYYLARPMPSAECRAWIQGRQPPTIAPILRLPKASSDQS